MDISLRPGDARITDEWASWLRANGAPEPTVALREAGSTTTRAGRLPDDVGVSVEDGAVVAISARRCGLTALSPSIGGLAFLDLRANRLRAVPAAVDGLPRLRKLDLRWNKLDPPRAAASCTTRRQGARTIFTQPSFLCLNIS